MLVVDIGGGSTELILGDGSAPSARGLDGHRLGPPARAAPALRPADRRREVAAASADIDAHLDACPVPVGRGGTVVGVAGTITTVAAVVLDLPAYDREAIDQAVLPRAAVHAFVDRLLAMTRRRAARAALMHPGRADVIGAGALILDRVLRRTRRRAALVSESDILDGIAWSLVEPVAACVLPGESVGHGRGDDASIAQGGDPT